MKKMVSLFTVAALSVCLVACSDDAVTQSEEIGMRESVVNETEYGADDVSNSAQTEVLISDREDTAVSIQTEVVAKSATAGQTNALNAAKRYLNVMPFSYKGLVDQLKYEGYTNKQAKYAADHCKANWKKQAQKKAKQYLKTMPFSYSGLVDQLKFDGFTKKQAKYGADHCNANWKKQAQKKAKQYLKIMDFSRDGLIGQLEFDGFTHKQAVYGVNAVGL